MFVKLSIRHSCRVHLCPGGIKLPLPLTRVNHCYEHLNAHGAS
jgi:hypothetical protein